MWPKRLLLLTTMSAMVSWSPITAVEAGEPSSLPRIDARPADDLVEAFGVNTHLGYAGTPYEQTAQVKQALVDLGVRHVRDRLFTNKPAMFESMTDIAAAGVAFNLIMATPRSWETPELLVSAIADRLPPDVVESLEGANEWNLTGRPSWAAELRAHQRAVWRAAQQNPRTAELPILAPALGQRTGFSELGDLGAYADLGNAHSYPGGQVPSWLVDEVTDAQRLVVPGKPVVFTESGYHDAMNSGNGHRPTPADVAGVYAPRLLLEHFLNGTERLYTYELIDERVDPSLTDHEAHFGLLRHDFSPKPAYLALQGLLSLTADPGPAFQPGSLAYRVTGAPADLRQVLLQKRDGTFILLLWRDASIYDRNTGRRLTVQPREAQVVLGGASHVTVSRPTEAGSSRRTTVGAAVPVTLTDEVLALEVAPVPLDCPDDAVAPSAPTDVSAVPGDRSVSLTWSEPADDGGCPVTSYRVGISPGTSVTEFPAGTTRATLDGLDNGTSYSFTVQAVSDAGSSPPGSALAVPAAAPAGPQQVTASGTRRRMVVSWFPPLTDGGAALDGYIVRESRTRKRVRVGPDIRNVTVPWALDVRKVRFAVRARNGVGTGPWSWSPVVRLR